MIDGSASAALDLDIVGDGVVSSPEKQGGTFPASYVFHFASKENQSPSHTLA
jgi:hypothetical protein